MYVYKECDDFTTDILYYDAINNGNPGLINLAWGCLFKKHFHFTKQIAGINGSGLYKEEDKKDAEDAYQEALIKTKNKIQSKKFPIGMAKLSSLIYGECFYEFLLIKRKRAQANEKQNRYLTETFNELDNSGWAKQELDNERKRQGEALKLYIKKLRGSCADILASFYYDNKTNLQIAGERNVGKQSVISELYRCRKELKDDLVKNNSAIKFWLWL